MICPDCGRDPLLGEWPLPCKGRGHKLGSFYRGDSAIHNSEKVVVYQHQQSGEIRIPGRGDRPIHPKLAAAGYVRRELSTAADIREVERKTNTIHEASNYNANSSAADRDTGSG